MPDNHSPSRITKLSPLLINQLAAGEVVTRPAAVVKELLENAIDAGATHIEVHITQGGMGKIEVVDNGIGIHPDDMVMAITRHATSKVADIANLQGITTLGFRGEALAAMAAVSRLTLTSSYNDSGIGRQLQVAGVLDDIPKRRPVVHQQGTTVTVKDLYFNVPARRGGLKSIATEFTHIETIVREVALARADVTLNLFHDTKKRLSLSASLTGTNQDDNQRLPLLRLEQALGMSLTEDALAMVVDLSSLLQHSSEHNDNGMTESSAIITGWLWPNHPQNALPKLLYVNGRLVKDVFISNQLRQIATSTQLDNIGYALYFELPTHWLNINVHPSKQRIKISPLNNIMAHLAHAIRLKLKNIEIPVSQNAIESLEQGLDKQRLNKQYPDNEPLPKAITPVSKSILVRQQVQSPKHQYQLSELKPSSKNVSNLKVNDTSLHQKIDSLPFSATSFPQCLNIITHLPKYDFIAEDDLSELPWLLFYSQGQYLLISALDWQQSEASLCSQTETALTAARVNQQVVTYAAKLSVQDAATFSITLAQTISAHAFTVIETEQLIAFMLSSAST